MNKAAHMIFKFEEIRGNPDVDGYAMIGSFVTFLMMLNTTFFFEDAKVSQWPVGLDVYNIVMLLLPRRPYDIIIIDHWDSS